MTEDLAVRHRHAGPRVRSGGNAYPRCRESVFGTDYQVRGRNRSNLKRKDAYMKYILLMKTMEAGDYGMAT